jgi:hypothetical protein
MGDIRMPRPIPSTTAALVAKKTQELQPIESPPKSEKYAEKLNMATDLHAQGIDPTRWTEAQPAAWAVQQEFQKTGQKDDRHFVVGKRLYRTTPQVAANQAQGQDAIDVYLGAKGKPAEQLVDVEKVPLVHPTGRPHDTRADRPDAHALNLHYARAGVDPASAQNGDPLPMESQSKLQQATRAADGSDIPLGISGAYRGYDDGYFYAANEGTQESPEVLAFRRKLAAEKAQVQGDASAMIANDNDPEIDEAIAWNYLAKNQPPVSKLHNLFLTDYRKYLSTISKLRQGLPLNEKEKDLCETVKSTFPEEGITATPANAIALPDIDNWLLNLFRGNPEGGSCPKPDCNEVYKHCQAACLDLLISKPNELPGSGSDKHGRFRRCVRECMEAHGCFDY